MSEANLTPATLNHFNRNIEKSVVGLDRESADRLATVTGRSDATRQKPYDIVSRRAF